MTLYSLWFWEKQFSSIDAEEIWCLECTYEEDELLQALSSMNSVVVKEDIMQEYHTFHK